MSVREDVVRIIGDVCPGMAIQPEQYQQSLLEIGLDSLDHATVLLQVEEAFNVKIPDQEAPSLVSVATIADFVAAHREAPEVHGD
jgi:acyl carrier protein